MAAYKITKAGEGIIPDGETIIKKDAFKMCKKLISIVIPEGVTTIENGAFKDCINLTSVTFPNSLEDIYWEAFSGCTGLTARYLKMYAILSHGHSIAVKTYQVL